MKKVKKQTMRWLSMLLVVMLCVSMLNLTAFADDGDNAAGSGENYTDTSDDTNNSDADTSDADTSDADEGDEDGDTEEPKDEEPEAPVKWDAETGTLTITGVKEELTGDLVREYLKENGAAQADLKNLVLNDVGDIKGYAFYTWALETVAIDGADVIGDRAFFNCDSLQMVMLKNVKTAGIDGTGLVGNIFAECDALTTVTLERIDLLGAEAFRHCDALEFLTVSGVDEFGRSPFSYCIGLKKLALDGVTMSGATAFYACSGLESVTLKNMNVGVQAFVGCTSLKTVTMENITTVGQSAFAAYGNSLQACISLETVTMTNVDIIGTSAFAGCTSLTTVDSLKNVKVINGFAFYNCPKLTGLTVEDATKMGFNGSYGDVMARVKAILEGRFQLDSAEEIKELELEGWTAGAVGKSENWDKYNNGTQIMEQARWQDTNARVAEVKVDAYYTAQKQMDYIFVADLSASMAQLGNPNDQNARFYDMQSKLLDMTNQLLGTPGYDCQVAIVTFGGYVNNDNPGTRASLNFTKDAGEAAKHIMGLEPLNENTDYKLGLDEVLDLLKKRGGSDRNTVVVFLSDGQPTRDGNVAVGDGAGKVSLADYNAAIANLAAQIKDEQYGVKSIYGVLHSPGTPGTAAVENAKKAMDAVCDEYYTSTDTESFGKAMNAAFTAAYGSNTVTIPVNAEQFDVSNLTVSTGKAVYSDGVITWTLDGMPFTQHTLTYNLTLKSDLVSRVGTYSYSINNGDAAFGESGAFAGVNLALSRTVAAPSTTYYLYYDANGGEGAPNSQSQRNNRTFTISGTEPTREGYVFEGWAIAADAETAEYQPGEAIRITGTRQTLYAVWSEEPEEPEQPEEPEEPEQPEEPEEPEEPDIDIPEDDVPLAPAPEEPDVEIPEDDVPLAGVPQTGDNSGIWVATAAMSAMGLVVLTLISKRKEEGEEA